MQGQIDRLLAVKGAKTPRQLHRELGAVLWDDVGMARNEAGLRKALERIPQLREEFWQNVSVPGTEEQSEQEPRIRRACRRLPRVRRSCSRSMRCTEPSRAAATSARKARHPTARRCATTTHFTYVAAWEFQGVGKPPTLHKEPLAFEYVKPTSEELQMSFQLPATSSSSRWC